MNRNTNPLVAWQEKNGVSTYRISKATGINLACLATYRLDRGLPSLIHAIKLSEATQGGVPPEAWKNSVRGQYLWHNRVHKWNSPHHGPRKTWKKSTSQKSDQKPLGESSEAKPTSGE